MTTAPNPGAAAFVTTRWSLVLRARGGSDTARIALGELCAAYWHPVHQFILRTGAGADAARDLTQEFFAQLLRRQGLDTVRPDAGRFRSFLLGAVRHFLADAHDRTMAAKRGGTWTRIDLDDESPNPARPAVTLPASPPPPDAAFDRDWAHSLLNRSVEALAHEYQEAGRPEVFHVLKPWLLGDDPRRSQGDAARELGLSENAVRVTIHRLRRRFRELVKAAIAETVDDPDEVQQELRYLLEVLSR